MIDAGSHDFAYIRTYVELRMLLASSVTALAFAHGRLLFTRYAGPPVCRFAALKKELLQKSSVMTEAALDF